MKKAAFIIFGFLLFSLSLKSQESILLYYNSKWEITPEDKATYYREAEYDLNNLKLNGKVHDYYLSDTLLMQGQYINGKRHGSFVFYNPNGGINRIGYYENNNRIGAWKYYYFNGKIKQIIVFPKKGENKDITISEFYDKNDNQLIKNGTGSWVNDSIITGLFDHNSLKRLSGKFKDSLKHGEWKLIRLSDNKLMHSEKFKKGKFIEATIYSPRSNDYGSISGEMLNKFPDEFNSKHAKTKNFKLDSTVFSTDLMHSNVETILKIATGKEYKIKNRNAKYIDGDSSLMKFIARNIRYSKKALEDEISGKVYVTVVIDSLGNTKSVKVLKGLQNEMDAEAVRVIQLITDWLPALRNGIPIESTITIPIRFDVKG